MLSGVQGNDNTVTNTFDKAGRLLTSLVEDAGVDRAAYAYTYNRADQVLIVAAVSLGDGYFGAWASI